MLIHQMAVRMMFSWRVVLLALAALALSLALALGVNALQGNESDAVDLEEYSNEYDDVRPHLIYPDEPRLDKRIGEAAKQFAERIKQAWHSMVDSIRSYFQDIGSVFRNESAYDYESGYD